MISLHSLLDQKWFKTSCQTQSLLKRLHFTTTVMFICLRRLQQPHSSQKEWFTCKSHHNGRMSYLQWPIEGILISEDLIVVTNTIQPTAIYQRLSYRNGLSSARQTVLRSQVIHYQRFTTWNVSVAPSPHMKNINATEDYKSKLYTLTEFYLSGITNWALKSFPPKLIVRYTLLLLHRQIIPSIL